MTTKPKRTTEPHDRLTGICDAALKAFEGHADFRAGDKCIVLADDERFGGLAFSGYEKDLDAVVSMFEHLRAIFQANGRDLHVVAIPDSPEGTG